MDVGDFSGFVKRFISVRFGYYSSNCLGLDLDTNPNTRRHREILRRKSIWKEDEECLGWLVYVNGRYVASLSKSSLMMMGGGGCTNLSPEYFSNDHLIENSTIILLLMKIEQKKKRL